MIDSYLGNASDLNDPLDYPVLEIWDCYWNASQVLRRAKQTIGVGFNGIAYLGISCLEIRAAVDLMNIPREEWDEITDAVQEMGDMVAEINNNRK